MGNCNGKEATAVQQRDVDDTKDMSVDKLFEKLQQAESNSMLKKHLTKEIFDELKDKTTKQGCDLKSCIKSGVDNLDSGIGVYAYVSSLHSPHFDTILNHSLSSQI